PPRKEILRCAQDDKVGAQDDRVGAQDDRGDLSLSFSFSAFRPLPCGLWASSSFTPFVFRLIAPALSFSTSSFFTPPVSSSAITGVPPVPCSTAICGWVRWRIKRMV